MNLNLILVGSNPLPCYVQAAYVLKKNRPEEEKRYLPVPDEILFVTTEATKEFAENIQKLLEEKEAIADCTMQCCNLKDGRDAKEIEDQIKEKLDAILEKKSYHHILLNNTGGTKVMTTHAALLCQKYAQENSIQVVECYVDPDKNRFRCFCLNNGETEIYPKEGQPILQDQVQMSVRELIELHYGTSVVIEDRNVEVREEHFEEDIKKLCGTDQQSFIRISERILNQFDVYKEFYKIWNTRDKRKDEKKEEIKKDPKLNELFKDVNEKVLLETLKNKPFDFWGRGDWLELYFYLALREVKQKLQKEGKNFDLVWSCKVRKDLGSKEFEVDVVTVRGFIMTLYSLTMAEPGETRIAKGKWFEAVYRTDQMGGGHGRTELVCLLSDEDGTSRLDDFVRDLERSDADRSIRIKTIESLKNYETLKESLMAAIE